MRKVVLERKEKTVAIDEVSTKKYYGVEPKSNKFRGFISRANCLSGEFIVLCSSYVTNGNGWGNHRTADLRSCISSLVLNGFDVKEFDTHKELFGWLAKN